MIELYGFGPSRWVKPYWMLRELGLEFNEHQVSLADLRSPAMLAMNPFGKTPIMRDGDTVLFESTAILNYLGEKHAASGLLPKAGTRERALYDQWTSFCITELEQPLWRISKHTWILPETDRIPDDVKLARREFVQVTRALEAQIGDLEFIVGNRFTAADITMAWTLNWARHVHTIDETPNCLRYTKAITSRPAFPSHLRFSQ
jgi:glutathione S-transferase